MNSLVNAIGVIALGLLSGEQVAAQADPSPVNEKLCIPQGTDQARVEPPTLPPKQKYCSYSIELAVAADDSWEVFVAGNQLTPTNGSNQDDWRTPASYKTTVNGTGSNIVIGIHARDMSDIQSGLLVNLRVRRLSPPTILPDWVVSTGSGNGWYAFQQPLIGSNPIPADWNTAPYLPFQSSTAADWAPATLASNACTSAWSGNSTFLTNWASASGGAAPSEWVWEYSCQAGTKPWRKENWYRFEVPLDYCPIEAPPPIKGCTWKLEAHGAADGLFDTPPVPGCTTQTSPPPPKASCIDRVGCHWHPDLCKYSCGFDFWTWVCVRKKLTPDD